MLSGCDHNQVYECREETVIRYENLADGQIAKWERVNICESIKK